MLIGSERWNAVALVLGAVAALAWASAADAGKRLADSGSPYLAQHVDNPVDWYPWGEAAFDRARREGKPVFLSIGYSTCYWCHVANRTLYANPQIAAYMNRWFVNVKVDREQRPDVDAVYMRAALQLNGRGGWPNNLFLTPERKPFRAGSYWPPEDDAFGRPGFVSVLREVHGDWSSRRTALETLAEKTAQALRAEPAQPGGARTVDPQRWAQAARAALGEEFDRAEGGFREAQRGDAKFPNPSRLAFLLEQVRRTGDKDAREMLVTTLDAMARGALHDHLGGGFHRYTLDPGWSVPHFEKMLYDNAQLLRVYALAWQLTGAPLYRQAALGVGDYLTGRLAAPGGGFYTAEDAESGGAEGAGYTWTREEIETALGADAARRFLALYALVPLATQSDADALAGTPRGALRLRRELPLAALPSALAPARAALLERRAQRPRPARDEKMVVSLNGLAIEGLALAGTILGRPAYVAAAERAATRIWTIAYDRAKRRLRHELFRGVARGEGFLDDYALLAQGFVALADARNDRRWRGRAAILVDAALERFQRVDGSLASTVHGADLPVAPDDTGDQAIPSGTATLVATLLRLAGEGDAMRHRPAAERIVTALSTRVEARPQDWPALLAATTRVDLGAKTAGTNATPPEALDTAAQVRATASHRTLPTHDEIAVRLAIAGGFHINANPASYDYLIPTALRFAGIAPTRVRYPQAKLFRPAFARDGLKVYDGTVELVAELPSGTLAHGATVRGSVRAQACDDEVCLPPAELPFSLTVTRAR